MERRRIQSRACYSIMMPVRVTTSRNAATSFFMKLASSAGELPTTSTPRSTIRLRTPGMRMILISSAFSRSTIGAGVPAGAATASQPVDL